MAPTKARPTWLARATLAGTLGALALAGQAIGGTTPPATAGPLPGRTADRAVVANQIDTTSMTAVQTAYLARWAPTTAKVVSSGGQARSCETGGTAAVQQQQTLSAINFARGLVGEDAVRFVRKYNGRAAAAALIMAANSKLSHDPPRSWRCWTRTGHDAAGGSNILLNSASPTPAELVSLYLVDPGSTNRAAGHRRWLLRPDATTMGSGNAHGHWFGNAIYLFTFGDDDKHAPARRFYGWPSAGYFPTQLVPGARWSVSSSIGARFDHAHVSVTGPNGNALALTRRTPVAGYADNTLVWDLRRVPSYAGQDGAAAYTVRITHIEGPGPASVTYQVKLFDPTR